MKTVDLERICPYTGLRSFTEEESLYFKGRDLQTDQITALLEQNKFLMITGASGEGKSSLIYGGLIPNARAGFFKARYTNWVIADFRPERSPVTNMASALSEPFNASVATVETELRRGYSSLIDLYTNSEFYINEEEEEWEQLPDLDKKQKRRKAANLMILVDQFEEFFTNPENFFNESPSKDSQIVVNLILETARIAIKKNIPVYVVCTMRSDYIGQCSAFRGLPEYIGFSQFFVPRLKRKDLKQVIEEPAILSGNSISQRLIERLVYDISDGVDQLPILQHALSRIWAAADRGSKEMDLLHYAMVGGMPENELPDEDMPAFRQWFNAMPEHEQKFYRETGLHKVIEIHANLLYENAWEYYNKNHPENTITQQEAKRIVALSFSCLTKIDNSRAVRNRMSLAEISGIVNSPRLNTEVISGVLNIFREEGNSFIRPFKTQDPATKNLSAQTVLDITHESLIRNWNKLNQWANSEFGFYSTFQDFKKQLDRWQQNGKSRGYLLPVGPLTYFEKWYNDCKPNKAWIRRYAEIREDPTQADQEAQMVLANTQEFLKKSARNEIITRSFMKYGPGRIATIAAIFIMLVLTGFYWYDADQKRNDNVIERVRTESKTLLKSVELNSQQKALYLLVEERYNQGSLLPYLNSLDIRTSVSLSIDVYKWLLDFDKKQESKLKVDLISLITKKIGTDSIGKDPVFQLSENNRLLILLLMDDYYGITPGKQNAISTGTEQSYALLLKFFQNKNLFKQSVPFELNMALQIWLTKGKTSPEKISKLIKVISPLAGTDAEAAFNTYYPKGSFEPNGRIGIDFNGGYHSLSSLYAAAGQIENIEWSFSKTLENNQRDYFDMPRILNSHLHIVGYLYQFGHRDKVPAMLKWLEANTQENPPHTILRNIVLRSGYISHLYKINSDRDFFRSTRGYLFPNLFLIDRSVFDQISDDYEKAAGELKNSAEAKFIVAMNQKRKAMFYFKYWHDRNMPIDTARLDQWLGKGVEIFRSLDSNFLEEKVSSTVVYFTDGVRTSEVTRRSLFLYPDYKDGWFSATYHGDFFFNYMNRKNLLDTLYKTATDLQSLHYWVAKAYEWKPNISTNSFTYIQELPDQALKDILDFVSKHPQGKAFDANLLYLILANHSFEKGDTVNGKLYHSKLELNNLPGSLNRYEYIEKTFFLNMWAGLCSNLAGSGMKAEAAKLTELLPRDEYRAFSYIQMSEKLFSQNADPETFVFLDSSFAKAKNVDYQSLRFELNSTFKQVMVLSEIGSNRLNAKASSMLKNMTEDEKAFGILNQVMGLAKEGNYYRALTAIPNTLTESQDLICRILILLEAIKEKEVKSADSSWKAMDNFVYRLFNYVNYFPI